MAYGYCSLRVGVDSQWNDKVQPHFEEQARATSILVLIIARLHVHDIRYLIVMEPQSYGSVLTT